MSARKPQRPTLHNSKLKTGVYGSKVLIFASSRRYPFEKQIAELNKNFASMLDQAAKSAPAGSEGVFAAVKSAMDTANSLYDNASKAAKQAAEVAEANMAAATEATVKAMTATQKAAGKK